MVRTWPSRAGCSCSQPGCHRGGPAASPNVSALQRGLSFEPLRLLGVISYGVYLWHWPVIVFASGAGLGLPRPALVAMEAALTLALAIVSFRLVESPIRRQGWTSVVPGRPRLAWTAIAGTVLLALVLTIVLPRTTTSLHGVRGDGIEIALPDYDPGRQSRRLPSWATRSPRASQWRSLPSGFRTSGSTP